MNFFRVCHVMTSMRRLPVVTKVNNVCTFDRKGMALLLPSTPSPIVSGHDPCLASKLWPTAAPSDHRRNQQEICKQGFA